jgi:RNase P subunit RPR2
MLCDCDYEAPSVFRQWSVKATVKPCKCDECGALLQTGSSVERVFCVYDGEPRSYTRCSGCNDFHDYALAHISCLCFSFGSMISDVLDAAREWSDEERETGAPELLDELSTKAKELFAKAKASKAAPLTIP